MSDWDQYEIIQPAGSKARGMIGGSGGAASAGPDIPESARKEAIQKLMAARMLERQLAETKRLYLQSQKNPGWGNQIREYFPSQQNGAFDASVDALKPLAMPFFRTPGEGGATEGDAARFENPLPNRWGLDATNDQKFKQLERIVGDAKRENSAIAGTVEEGTVIVNRTLGKRMIMKGGQWRDL